MTLCFQLTPHPSLSLHSVHLAVFVDLLFLYGTYFTNDVYKILIEKRFIIINLTNEINLNRYPRFN